MKVLIEGDEGVNIAWLPSTYGMVDVVWAALLRLECQPGRDVSLVQK
jgi:hypothetical protein